MICFACYHPLTIFLLVVVLIGTSYRDCLRVQQAAQEATPDRMAQEFTRYANVNRLFAANLNQMSDNLLEAIEDEDELAMHEYANKIRNLLTRE